MKHFFILFLTVLSIVSTASAQFPGGGGGGGFGGFGGGKQEKQTKLPGTADDDRPRGTGKISGVIIDSTTNKPVEFANVAILDAKTKKPIDGAMADDRGRFSLKNVAAGDWILSFNFLGLRNATMPIKIEKKGTDLQLGNVFMSPDIKMLKEINVVGTASLIEEKVDRLVFNAEKDLTSRGGDATEVLKKVPMLSVDLDGNVSLRGSSNIRVLINNKPSTIIASSVADALKQIPAEMIKTVEVITSPSAKYDAEGSAGIINIITKKNTLQGVTLSTDLSVGNRGGNLGLNGSYRKGKFGMNLGGFGRAIYNVKGKFESEQLTKAANLRTLQNSETHTVGAFGNYNLSMDYDLDKNNSFTGSLRYGVRNNNVTQNDLSSKIFQGVNLIAETHRDVDSKDLSGNIDANIDYTRQLGKPQQELSISSQYSLNNRTNDYVADLLKPDLTTLLSKEYNPNKSTNQEQTIQIDYTTPIKKNQIFEIGTKGIFRQVTSDFQYLITTSPTGEYVPNPRRTANIFNYNQNVGGAYFSYTYQTKNKWSIKVGSRYEYTKINANFSTDKNVVIPDYGNIVPSINLSKNLKGGLTVKWAYNRRLQRPSIQFLNPNINAANPQSIQVGNPYLNPELTDNFEMTLSKFFKGTYLSASLFTRRTNNSISSIRTTDDKGVITTTYQNIGQDVSTGSNIFGNVQITPKFSVGGGVDFFYANLTNNSPDPSLTLSNAGWVYNYRFFTNWTIKNGWGVQGFGFLRSSQVQLQGTQAGFGVYSLGVKKDFKNKKGSLGFGAENFLSETFNLVNRIDSPTLSQNSTTYLFNRGFKVTFSYKIGKMSFDGASRKRKKSVNNDDQKSEDGGGGQQQSSPQPTGGRPATVPR